MCTHSFLPEEENILEVSFCLHGFSSKKQDREVQIESIISRICALLNSDGGKLRVYFDGDFGLLQTDLKRFHRMIEQKLLRMLGCSASCSLILVSPLERNEHGLVFVVSASTSLYTANYNLYIPTETQVILISPSEPPDNVKRVLYRELREQERLVSSTGVETLVYKKRFPLQESDRVQFKNLKSKRSKCVSIGDRIVSKSNKLDCYISAFGNKHGGRLYYGITCEGIVEGEILRDYDSREIIRKVTKTISKMIWCGGELTKGKQWEIQFEQVKDENMSVIPSLFVVIISVAPLLGGLFTKEPESYHVVKGEVKRMSFDEWKSKFFGDEPSNTVTAPRNVNRSQWSSVKMQKIYHTVSEKLSNYRNDYNFTAFERCAKWAEKTFRESDVKLIILAERIARAYRTGLYEKAKRLLAEYEECLSSSSTKDALVFWYKAVYAASAIARAEGDYQKSYEIATGGLQQAEFIPAGIVTALFYTHVALVETILSQTTEEENKAISFREAANDHYLKALQHAQASSVEREFFISLADLRQRVYINRTITSLGYCFSGEHVGGVKPTDLEAAKRDLGILSGIILEGYPETCFREIHHLFALSDLNLCQWQQQEQNHHQPQTLKKTSLGTCKSPDYLTVAFSYAKKALKLADDCHFEEMIHYAMQRLAVLTEFILRRKVSGAHISRKLSDVTD